MKLRNNIRFASAVTLLSVFGFAGSLSARENVVTSAHKQQGMAKATASGCIPATSEIDLDINNVRAKLMTGGDMWWDRGQGKAAYEIPKGSGKSSQFAASCWIGGFDKQGQLKVAAQTYRQDGNDYWPGALDVNAKITSDVCAVWDHQWKVDRSVINSFIQLYKINGNTTGSMYDVINEWPATGNPKATGANNVPLNLNSNNTYAPFVDLNGNGIYEPSKGEYPDITGDEYIWWVFNDAGNVKQQSLTSAMGVEVQTSAFAYATQDFLNNATFCNYRVINRGALTIDSTYIAVWDDCDLGYAYDDFIGCDTARGLGIQYNGNNDDGGGAGHPVNSYGLNPPQVGLDFFQGPLRVVGDTTVQLRMTNFTYYNNDASIIGNPDNGVQIYYYMTGSIKDGERFADDFQGPGSSSKGYGSGPVSNFVFWGDPGDKSEWSECACNNNPSDRRFIFSSGPFQLLSGALNDITFGCIWAEGVGGCPSTNFKTIKNIDDGAQALFDSHFKTVEGPEAPRMVVRELDRKLVFYLVNDYGSNNYGENYGNMNGTYKDSAQYHQVVVKSKGISNDSLYHFEGYRVFQLADQYVTTADIFDPNTGEVNTAKAVEVFQTDVQNGVKQIVNYAKNASVSDTTSTAQIKVTGAKDSGIVHSFVLSLDKFAPGSDKQFINFHSYYFVAIAYAYNNFAPFDPNNTVGTQDAAYIGSAHAAGGTNVTKITAIPNASNGDLGNILNSDYGDGVVITRIQGQGNGGNIIQMDTASENKAIANGLADSARYLKGQGPISVKVVDPVKVPAADVISDWVLQINGDNTGTGLSTSASWKLTGFLNGIAEDTIYSEETIGSVNEQIIEKYGLSINVSQKLAPGTDQVNGNGYITSDITFDEIDKPWLFGIPDQPDSSSLNWLRSGNTQVYVAAPDSLLNPCNFNDYSKTDTNSAYQNMLANFTPTKSTWGPYVLAAAWLAPQHVAGKSGTQCGFEIAYSKVTQTAAFFHQLPDVDVVFTSDKTKWTKCAVIEEQEDPRLSQGGASKFSLRRHLGWTGETVSSSESNTPLYSTDSANIGTSWFPGYAINEATGERLNIVFGEDSYLAGADHGDDMLWNPSSNAVSTFGTIIFGGKHIVYVANTRYDSCKAFMADLKTAEITGKIATQQTAYSTLQWTGVPILNPLVAMKSLADGYIPTKTTLRFKVNRPYEPFAAVDTNGFAPNGVAIETGKATNPYYVFSTKDLAPTLKSDTTNRKRLLDKIFAVPNPYYGYSGYEGNRLDTKVRIINLPAQTTIHIYSLDGSLVRTLTKNDPNTPYIDWDIRNSAGLPVASGMYLMHVNAEGIGETVIRWFGATRPIDISTY